MGRRPKATASDEPLPAVQILSQATEMVPVEHLIVHPDNPNHGDLRAVMDSIRAHGFWGTIIANKRTRYVLAGNHRFQAAVQLGLTQVPVSWVDVNDETERRILVADNRLSRRGKDDDEKLAAILTELQGTDEGLGSTGYDDGDLDNIIASLARKNDIAERNKTPQEGFDNYNAAVHGREIHLAYTATEYNKVIEMLEILLVKYGCDNYSEAVRLLLEDHAD